MRFVEASVAPVSQDQITQTGHGFLLLFQAKLSIADREDQNPVPLSGGVLEVLQATGLAMTAVTRQKAGSDFLAVVSGVRL
jgi:hypothetical protein